jgi:hypothetical protein
LSPTARTLVWLRHAGFISGVVERWLPGVNLRSDLWGFADVLAVHPRERTFLLVQATTIANMASRLAKSRTRPELAAWLRAGGQFEVHGWVQRGSSWRLKIIGVRPDDLETTVVRRLPRRARPTHQRELFSP